MEHTYCAVCRPYAGEPMQGTLQVCEDCRQKGVNALNFQSGFICISHSASALYYCMCREVKEYLCSDCIAKHMMIGRSHALVRLDADAAECEDIPKLNQRRQTKEWLQGMINALHEKLEMEQQSAQTYLQNYELYHQQELCKLYQSLRSKIFSEYAEFASMLNQLTVELQSKGDGSSPSLALFIDNSVHLFDRSQNFIDVEGEVTSSVHLSFVPQIADPLNCLSRLLTRWLDGREVKCECDKCEEIRELFGLPRQRQWVCYQCRTENKGTNSCAACFCGREWTDYLCYNDVKLTEDRKKWICSHCSRKNNLYDGNCQCKKTNSVILAGLSSLPVWLRRIFH